VVLRKELRQHLVPDLEAYLPIPEVPYQVVVAVYGFPPWLGKTLEEGHDPEPFVQHSVILQELSHNQKISLH
jgi:hypothetical protein